MHEIPNVFTKEKTISSLEVAEMVEKEHNKLMRDIRTYIDQLGQSKIGHSEFFKESTYQSEQNKTLPCFEITKKGCEFIANKLTGVKGASFTARYINRFHDMEEHILKRDFYGNSDFMLCLQGVKFITDDMKLAQSSRLIFAY